MKTLIWSLTLLLAALWSGLVWLTHGLSAWLLGSVSAPALKDAGSTVAGLALPPVPPWLAPWLDPAWLADAQDFAAAVLGWFGGVLPSGDTLLAWVGPLLWVGWGMGLLLLLALALFGHWLAGRGTSLRQVIGSARA
jgi:hypothetical protein